MIPATDAADLRTLARELSPIEDRVGSMASSPRTSDDTQDVLSRVGIALAGIIDALELQAEMLSPTAVFTLAQLDHGLSVQAVQV